MKTFEDIYKTVQLSEGPRPRSIYDIKILLAKAYEVAENGFFVTHQPFSAIEDSPLALHRTTVQRMIHEITLLEDAKSFSVLTSQGMELLIEELYYIDKWLQEAPKDSEYLAEPVIAGRVKGIMRCLVDDARTSVIGTTTLAIQQGLAQINGADEKVKHLARMLLSYKQRKAFIDAKQYDALCQFIKLEKKKWELDMDNPNNSSASKAHHTIAVSPGGIVNVSHGNNSVQAANTGAGAQLNVASGKTVSQNISVSSSASLNELLQQLAQFIVSDEAFAANRQEMQQQLETVKVQLQKSEPKKGIIKRAFESLTELAADGAGVMAGHAIFEVLHKSTELLTAAGIV